MTDKNLTSAADGMLEGRKNAPVFFFSEREKMPYPSCCYTMWNDLKIAVECRYFAQIEPSKANLILRAA